MSNSKTALYHNDNGLNPRELHVVRENADGTVDLASQPLTNDKDVDAAHLVVTRCKVGEDGKAGTCSIEGHRPKKGAQTPADDEGETKAEAAAREKREEAQRKEAADAAHEKAEKAKADAAKAGKK